MSWQPQTLQDNGHASAASGNALHLHGIVPEPIGPPPLTTHSHDCVTPLTGNLSVESWHGVGAGVGVGAAEGASEHFVVDPLPPLPLPFSVVVVQQ